MPAALPQPSLCGAAMLLAEVLEDDWDRATAERLRVPARGSAIRARPGFASGRPQEPLAARLDTGGERFAD